MSAPGGGERLDRAIRGWHALVEGHDPSGLEAMLADEVVFHSPVVHTPQVGKRLTSLYLTAAFHVLNNAHFRYVGEWRSEDGVVLEFRTEVGGIQIDGIDMITWDPEGRITEFKVMVRPLKAINLLHAMMRSQLEAASG